MTLTPITPDHDTPTQCGAKTRRGTHCTLRAGWGTNHVGLGPCKLHGGSTPNVANSLARRTLEARVQGELTKRGFGPVTDPLAKYAELAGETWEFKELCRDKLAELHTWVTVNELMGNEDAKALITIYERALDRTQKTLADMLRIGIDAKALNHATTKPTRDQANTLSRVITHLLDQLDLTPTQQTIVPTALAAALQKEGLL